MAIDNIKCKLQHLIPHHSLSRILAKLADCNLPFLKNTLIKIFIRCYKIDLNIAATSKLSDYKNFNAFFIRALKQEARPIAQEEDAIISPADGTISQLGPINNGMLYQAKGHLFNLIELLGGDWERASQYQDGNFVTIYLAPHDYHRVHMPLDGKLLKTIYVPGKLFSVNNRSVANVPNLFCRNERLICLFDTAIGQVAVILVGAMLVAGIRTVWGEQETPCHSREILVKDYAEKNIRLNKGMEMGHFQYGSTVILLFPPDTAELSTLSPQQPILMGSNIGRMIKRQVKHGSD